MPDIKFACSQCGQHISCDELWSGHQIQCPGCQQNLIVPGQAPASAPADPAPSSLVPQPPAGNKPKLSAGVTQVARSTAPAPVTQKRRLSPMPKSQNPLIKYAGFAVFLLVLGVLAYNFLPGLLKEFEGMSTSSTSGAGSSPANAGAGAGPLGEVNGAMDVSDALDGGGSSSRPRSGAAKQSSPQPRATIATNSAAKSPNDPRRPR